MKADPKAEAAPPKASKKKLMVIIAMALLVVALGGGSAWFFTRSPASGEAEKEVVSLGPPQYVVIDSFTVNLQPEEGEQYLQIQFTLQMPDAEQVTVIKDNMPRVRSRMVMLLSSKRASELVTAEGKRQLSSEIIAAINQPFAPKAPPQKVSDVLFTSFIIQ